MKDTVPETTLEACESLLTEHRQTESLIAQLETQLQLLQQPSVPEEVYAALDNAAKAFTTDLDRHFACEEQCLFPVLSRYAPMVLMELEHENLLDLRSQLISAIGQCCPEDIQTAGKSFIKELQDHIGREEFGIFPIAEQRLSLEEKNKVIQSMTDLRGQMSHQPPSLSAKVGRGFEPISLIKPLPEGREVFLEKVAQYENLTLKAMGLLAGHQLKHWSPQRLYMICLEGKVRFESLEQDRFLLPGEGVIVDPRLEFTLYADETSHLLFLNQDIE